MTPPERQQSRSVMADRARQLAGDGGAPDSPGPGLRLGHVHGAFTVARDCVQDSTPAEALANV